jgi:ABC-type transport system involved in multi-copper enzyme maturation permease subunit
MLSRRYSGYGMSYRSHSRRGIKVMILKPILTIARFTLLESVKNRLFTLVLLGVVSLFGLTLFIGELAVTETTQIQSAMTGLVLRLFAVFIICIFVITSMIREFNDKGFELIISLPIDRYLYLAGKMTGFCLLAAFIAIIVSMPLALIGSSSQLLLWCLSLICELWILIALCLLCLVTFKNITSAFSVVMAFYLLARTISTIQLIGNSPILETANLSHLVITKVVDIIAFLLPALDQFSKTEWLVYGGGGSSEYIFIAVQTVIYIPLLFAAACFDLHRKNF